MSLQMSQEEREAFLAGVHVGVMSIERADGPPLTVPVWYDYEPGGDVVVIMGEESVKNRLLPSLQPVQPVRAAGGHALQVRVGRGSGDVVSAGGRRCAHEADGHPLPR